MHSRWHFFFVFAFCLSHTLSAQEDTAGFFSRSKNFNKKRVISVFSTDAILYTGLTIGLNEIWYKGYQQSAFHFFNDNEEWLQMDKVGHLVSSYNTGRNLIEVMKWSGLERKKAVWYGGTLGFMFLTTIEFLDGFSSQWGFSSGDFLSNSIGTALLIGQELTFKDQRILLKFSFNQSKYYYYHPSLLGNNYFENILKDYNGQTCWASCNIASFLKKENTFPKWLNIAFGYGAEGMIGARGNYYLIDKNGNQIIFDRYRQYYLSLDIDLTKIKTKSSFLTGLFKAFGFVKFPSPTLELSKNGLLFKPLYF